MISSASEVSLTFRPNPADPFPSQTRRRRRISKISEAGDEQNVSTHARARDGVVVPPRREPRARCPRRTWRPRRPSEGPAAPTAVAVVRQVLPSVPGRRDRRDRKSPHQPTQGGVPQVRGRDGPDGRAPAAAVARGARVWWVGGCVGPGWLRGRGCVGGDGGGGVPGRRGGGIRVQPGDVTKPGEAHRGAARAARVQGAHLRRPRPENRSPRGRSRGRSRARAPAALAAGRATIAGITTALQAQQLARRRRRSGVFRVADAKPGETRG